MKFLRLAFYVLIAQLVLSGCAGEAVEETSSSSSSEINFDAYLGTNASTRVGETNLASLKETSGFSVFARHTHANGAISDMMDNEHVTWRGNHWGYDHIRFWPSSGKVDFYAFAPYSEQVKMGGLPDSLVNQADSNSPNTYIDFPSNWSPIDLIWSKQPDQTAPTSPDSKVTFQFKHALARLSFDITANPKIEEKDVVIKVKEVRLYGAEEHKGIFRMAGYLNLKTGDWVPYNNKFSWFYTWTPDGKVDGKDESQEEQQKKGPIYKLSAPPQLDHTNDKITNADDSYIFIIPQTKTEPFHLAITYTVQQGDFKETVTVKKNLLDVLDKSGAPNPSFTFEKGNLLSIYSFSF